MQTRDLLDNFYQAFQRRDAETMTALYHPQARFEDEVFKLQGREEIGAMWSMLCTRGKDLTLDYEILSVDGPHAEVRWIARYTFSATGRKVVNRIHATIQVQDGLIIIHRDRFDFWAWSRQALGLPGLLLGWTPFLRNKVARQAQRNLVEWRSRRSG